MDHIVEPIRAMLIPGFNEVKMATKNAGALGTGISGSGPSIFSLSKGEKTAEKVAQAMKEVYITIGVDYDIYISKINKKGIYPIE